MTPTDSTTNSVPLTLIFVEKKRDAARVEKELIRAGFDAMSIHGDRSQREREHALKMFRMGKVSLLVATDVASRGLDIPNVLYVINYDLPNNIDAYVHRIGRTGRCGNNGNAISFVNENNKPVIKSLMNLLKESKSEIPQWFADLYYKFGNFNYHKKYNKYSGGYNKYGNYNNNSYGGGGFGGRDFRNKGRGGNKKTFYHRNNNQSNYNQNSGGGGGGGNNWGNNANTTDNNNNNDKNWGNNTTNNSDSNWGASKNNNFSKDSW
eukprot:262671_1